MKKLVLIDSNALVHRAFHALPASFNSPKGVPTNAVYGFVSVLIKMIKELKPEYIAATFDLAGPTFRHEEFAEYKSHRIKAPDELYSQVPYIKQILTAFGIPIYEKEGFEADDLIGTLAEKAHRLPDLQTVIMTGDLDTLQLVRDDKVVVFTLRKGVTDTVLYNEKGVQARYDLLPRQLADFKGLKGDPSDNIPGVPGIGDKTASALINEFGSLEKLYKTVESKSSSLAPKLIEKLKEHKDQAIFSKRLATIITDVELEFDLKMAEWLEHFNRPKLEELFRDLALYSLLKRIDEIDGKLNIAEPVISDAPQVESNLGTVAKVLKEITNDSEMVLDILGDKLLFSGPDGKNIASVSLGDINKKIKSVLENKAIKKTTHDAKQACRDLFLRGVDLKGLDFDTKLAAYILNSGLKDYSLNKIYFNEFSRDYSDDIRAIVDLKNLFQDKLKSGRMAKVFEKIELPLSPVLARMELAGIKVEPKVIAGVSAQLVKNLSKLEKEIHKLAGKEFNINSPQQLAQILFEPAPAGLGLKGKIRKTGKGAISTAAPELEKLIDEHPVIPKILEYREYQKLESTYLDPFPGFIDKKSGRLHTTFNQTGAATGRLASQDPNLQNIPIRTDLGRQFRRSFVAGKGNVLLSCDYSQLELRIVAHISKDEKMTKVFQRGEDIHTRTAAEIFNVPPKKVTAEMRRKAKALNFGIIYGMGVLGFQRAVKVSREQAKDFITRYMKEFSGINRYMAETKTLVHEKEYVETLFGRRRYLPEVNSGMPQLVAMGERMAINSPIQGGAADLIKLAMIEIDKLISESYDDSVKMLLQVHDELLFEVKKDVAEKFAKEAKKIMETVYKFDVPIVVAAKVGNNWAEMKELS